MIDDLKRISEAREIQNTSKVSHESKGINPNNANKLKRLNTRDKSGGMDLPKK
jgi:hypothetical protein